MTQGLFFAFEGGDCAGKTSAINHMKEVYPEFVYNREPGGTGFAQMVREVVLADQAKNADPLAMFHMFWASRAENFAKVIKPAVDEGKIVVTDRFDASTFAFQIGENPRLANLFWQTREVCLQGVKPIYLDFDVSHENFKARRQSRGENNHFDLRDDHYHSRVRSFYDEFFSKVEAIQIDANQDKDTVVHIAQNIVESIVSHHKRGG